MNIRDRRQQPASIEFALMLMLGLLPLLLFTFSGVMIMAAQQTLATASAEGLALRCAMAAPMNGVPQPP
jgi:uncharacterized membrane protein SpoIIM required for sporulation